MVQQSTGKPAEILYVDDEPFVRTAFRSVMARHGYAVDVAESGAEALVLASRRAYSVVVSDLMMPGMGGLALIQRLKAELKDAVYIAVTGLGRLDLANDCTLDQDILAVISKPWVEREMVSVVVSALERRQLPRVSGPAPLSVRDVTTRILLVEDNPGDTLLVRIALEKVWTNRYSLVPVETLSAARAVLSGERFDIILSDLYLPDSSGLDTVLALQKMTATTPLVVISGMSENSLALKAVQAGAQDYLGKNEIKGDVLLRAIRYSIERKNAEQNLLRLANYDQLTGLANRTLFRQKLADVLGRSMASREPFALLMLDLDRFKGINDGLGRHAGDTFLREVARRLEQAVAGHEMVARLGEDEFAVLVDSSLDQERLVSYGQRLLTAVAAPLIIEGTHCVVTASMGVALYPDTSDHTDGLLNAAAAALEVSKSRGRNNVQVAGMISSNKARARLQLEAEIRGAIDGGKFLLHFQPQFDLRRSVVGAEALLRWDKGGDAPVSGGPIIPILEETDLIVRVGSWALETACSTLRYWHEIGRPVPRVSVNVSARQLQIGDLVGVVTRCLEENQLSADSLELELTESAVMTDTLRSQRILEELHRMGVRIAIDDFGTGYSSLSYLRRFPVNTVKIDQSFVKDLEHDASAVSIARAIIALARSLELEVVAEGVETEGQYRILRAEGCDVIQGYLWGRPVHRDVAFEGAFLPIGSGVMRIRHNPVVDLQKALRRKKG